MDIENPTLIDVVDIDHLHEVQEKLSNLVKVSVVTTDVDGRPVSGLNNFTPFCQLIRSTEKGRQRCEQCDKRAELQAFREKRSIIYDCHLGLKDCCVPITVGDKLLGAVLGGQVLVSDDADAKAKIFDIPALSQEYGVPEDHLREAVRKIFVVDYEYLENCVDLYEMIANYSKEMGMKSIAQQKLVEEVKDRLAFERRAKYAELKTLEAQINPHFLFNTLNSIARMAMFEDAPDTEEMIYNLSDLLRYNLRQTEDYPLLEKELDNLQRYLALQKTRYQDRLDYEIVADAATGHCLIPMMILQPLVENAIIHGLEPLAEGGRLVIEVNDLGEHLQICIKDTGTGIPIDMRTHLLGNDTSSAPGLGVINSHLRLKDAFGPASGLQIYENEEFSTIVELVFPKVTDKRLIKEMRVKDELAVNYR